MFYSVMLYFVFVDISQKKGTNMESW